MFRHAAGFYAEALAACGKSDMDAGFADFANHQICPPDLPESGLGQGSALASSHSKVHMSRFKVHSSKGHLLDVARFAGFYWLALWVAAILLVDVFSSRVRISLELKLRVYQSLAACGGDDGNWWH